MIRNDLSKHANGINFDLTLPLSAQNKYRKSSDIFIVRNLLKPMGLFLTKTLPLVIIL